MANQSVEKNKEIDKQLAESREMHQFFRSCWTVSANAVARIMRENDANRIIKRAMGEVERMRKAENSIPEGPHKCKPGQIWDESLGRCVDL